MAGLFYIPEVINHTYEEQSPKNTNNKEIPKSHRDCLLCLTPHTGVSEPKLHKYLNKLIRELEDFLSLSVVNDSGASKD